jgi:hypothetical protein
VLGACYCVMALSAGVWVALLAFQKAMTPKGLRSERKSTTLTIHGVPPEGEFS